MAFSAFTSRCAFGHCRVPATNTVSGVGNTCKKRLKKERGK